MSNITITGHAAVRMRQRGYSEIDLVLLRQFGVETADGMFMPRKHAAVAASGFRRLAERTERLAGSYGVVQGGRLVSMYRPGKEKRKRLLRNVPRSEWED
jgi:hypothetical protein